MLGRVKPMAHRKELGFTMTELVIVVLILGTLAIIALPMYLKSSESAKADDAASVVQMLASTNRMYALNNGGYTTGQLNGCAASGACGSGNPTVCNLLFCNFLASQDFTKKKYNFFAADGGTSATDPCGLGAPADFYVACAMRQPDASAPYSSWGYTVTKGGVITGWPAANGPPPPPP